VLLFAALAIQIFAQECKEKKSLILKDGLKMKCRRGKWIPIEKRGGPSGPPCEDDSSLLAQGVCSSERGHCNQYTDKGVKMDTDCPGTCGSCDGCRCQDASQWHTYCPYWEQYCSSPGVLGTWMEDNCRKTCDKCKCNCCSYKGKKHRLGDIIHLADQCGALVCEEGLVAGASSLVPGASLHNVSHPEELTLSFKSLFPGSDCCILPADAEEGGSVLKNQSMVQEGWSGKFNKDGMVLQATCCHGKLSVPLEDAVFRNIITPSSSPIATASTADVETGFEDCKSGWQTIESKEYCYNKDSVTWDQAQAACEKMGGNLASILDSLTRAGVAAILTTTNDRVWIGLNKVGGSWAWVDNSPWGETQWWPGNPSGDGACGELISYQGNIGLNDLSCLSTRDYVCKKK